MANQLMRADTISAYNDWAGVETLNPLAGYIDFSQVSPLRHARKLYGFYAIFLKDAHCGELRYGRQYYDYQDGTLIFIAPGQAFGAEDDGTTFQPTGHLLMFHPDLLRGTALASNMKQYSFFSYEVNEALHLSEQERQIILDCLHRIDYELKHPIDKHSRQLIVDSIKTFLDYSTRFYDRQFITRENANQDVLVKFEKLLDQYFDRGTAEQKGLPSVQYFASELHLSANYLSDLMKKETGQNTLQFIHDKVINLTKEQIVSTNKTVSEIAYSLGFQYPQHLTRLFKREVGCTPRAYREQILSPN